MRNEAEGPGRYTEPDDNKENGCSVVPLSLGSLGIVGIHVVVRLPLHL